MYVAFYSPDRRRRGLAMSLSTLRKSYLERDEDTWSAAAKLILYSTPRESTDPRDQVYGLMSLLRPLGLDVTADYNKPTREVYEDMVVAWISHYKTLDDGLWGCYLNRENKHSLPSWVYDFEQKSWDLHNLERGFIRYYCEATQSSEYHLSSFRKKGQLPLCGRTLGVIKQTGVTMPEEEPSARTLLEAADSWTSFFLREGRAISNRTRGIKTPLHFYNDILFRGKYYGSEDEKDHDGLKTAWRDWTVLSIREADFRAILVEKIQNGYFPTFKALRGTIPISLDTGYIGIGTAVEPRDIVVLAEGASLPLVIRPEGEFYKLVCVCYIPGIENGEAWHDASVPDAEWFGMTDEDCMELIKNDRDPQPSEPPSSLPPSPKHMQKYILI
jgi:hypothetical protein